MIHSALSKQAQHGGVNTAPELNNGPEIFKSKEKSSCRAHNRWDGGIMGYCEFRPRGNGRPADNPTALARYLKSEQTCLQVTQNLLLCSPALRFLIIAHFTHRGLE